ncbi:MAG: DNA translocase FtsK 4TM domain-containing protein, partial [Acidimicrobiales bacterium]
MPAPRARRAPPAPEPVPPEGPGLISRVSDDTWGLALLVVAAVVALGTWVDLTGPVGRASRAGLGAAVGWAAVTVPVLLAACGWALARGRGRPLAARLAFGGSLVIVAVAGLSHVASGHAAGAPVSELRSAGGLAGAALGAPLRAALSIWGGSLVLLVLLTGGLLVIAGMPVASAIQHLGALCRRGLAKVPRPKRAHHPVDLYDQDADNPSYGEEDEEASRRKRRAKPTADAPAGDVPQVEVHVSDSTTTAGSQLAIDLGPAAEPGAWKLPPLSLLQLSKNEKVDTVEIERRGQVLQAALAQHGVETRLVNMTVGPTVTRYELELGSGVKVARVTSLHKDIAYAMAAPDVRIQAP